MDHPNRIMVPVLLGAAAIALACSSEKGETGGAAGTAGASETGGAAGTAGASGAGAASGAGGTGGAAATGGSAGTGGAGGTGNLVSFVGSPCKKEVQSPAPQPIATRRLAPITGVDPAAVVGLRCISWERTGADGLKIDLVNFDGACGAQWSGDAAVDASGSLVLGLVNPDCAISRCGVCIYDWSFELRAIPSAGDLPLTIRIDTCPGQQPLQTWGATLPLASSPQGMLCRYADWNALGWQASATSTCATINMPCLGAGMCSSATTGRSCNQGLVCDTNGTADQYICLLPCSAQAPCPAGGVLSCQAGLCRPASVW